MKRIMQACVLLALLFLALLLVGCGTVQAQGLDTVVPCSTDADCHAKNPGLCAEDEPYCRPMLPSRNPVKVTVPEAVGMSRWAFAVALAGPAANVLTQEAAFAHFGVYDKLVQRRMLLSAANLSLPFAVRWLLRKAPRTTANVNGVAIGAWGFFDAGRNVHVMLTLKP